MNVAQNRPTFGRSKKLRGADLFDTPPRALDPLFAQEPLLAGVTTICEPFAGKGNLVIAMRSRGLTVHASDISDRGCPDACVLDFLQMTERPPNCDVLVSNCPYNGAMEFIEHALSLGFRVLILLLSADFVCTADRRERLHAPGHLRRIHVLDGRLQGMHDAAHIAAGGKKASQPLKHAWHVIDRDYCGPATINPVSLKQPAARLPWQREDSSEAEIPSIPEPLVLARTGKTPPDDPTLPPAHSPFGGSVAARVLRCPASVGLVEKVPPHLRKSSAYAERGTALHAAMALLIERERTLADIVGEKINGYVITQDDAENALRPVLTYVDELLDTPRAEYYLERRVAFPTINGAFGTADLIIRIGRAVNLIDFKFGAGVRVLALAPDGSEDVINAQLLFYAAAARYSLGGFFAGVDNIVLTILQPQSIDPDAAMESSVVVTPEELDTFVTAYRAACAEACAPAPRLQRGNHCRFCPARPVCPAHTGPLLDLAQFALPPRGTDKAAYARMLAEGLDLVDAVKDLRTALHDQAKRALENGDLVPGYALTAGRAERHWCDENAAIAALESLGLARGDVVAETMRSPKQVELRAKARGVKVPKELIVSHPSGVALVRCENARAPVPGRGEIVRSFSAALEAFQGGRQP